MGDGVLELRLVVTAPDYDEALRFYRDVLGLPELGAFDRVVTSEVELDGAPDAFARLASGAADEIKVLIDQ